MQPRRRIRNSAAEESLFRLRAAIGFACVVLGFLVLAGWYFRLQILQHRDFASRAEANRVRLRPVVPGRGLIYDRKGRVLAENVPAYRLEIWPQDAGNLDALVKAIAPVIAMDEDDLRRFATARKNARPFQPITLKLKISDEEAARFAVDRWRYPGVELVPYLTRQYPYGDLFAHVVGYVGRVDEKDRTSMGEDNIAYTHTGKTGLERYYEAQLRGKLGYEQVETNVDGRALGTTGRVAATAGTDLKLSIDAELQRAMVDAFGELEGTAIAVDPRTGEILAMVSLPSYDPNLFVNGISHADYKALNENPSRPQFNRAVLGGVAPGSTIKPILGLAGLDSGIRTPEDRVLSKGMFYLAGQRRGYADLNHGWTDLRKSIYESVNTYYYKLAMDMGIAKFDEYMTRYGFGQRTGVDLSGEIEGILPSPAWKAKNARQHGPWYTGDTVISGIGQGFWKVTPLQLVQATAMLADNGRLRRPHLVRETRNGFDQPWQLVPQSPPRIASNRSDHLQAVREGMILTVHGSGTATNIRPGLKYTIASKTGTAQVVNRRGQGAVNPRSLPMHLRHRALFIAYAPAEAPQIAIAVAVEGGGYGASTAAPIARKVLDAWLLHEMPKVEAHEPDPQHASAASFDGVVSAVNGATSNASSAASSGADFRDVRGMVDGVPAQRGGGAR